MASGGRSPLLRRRGLLAAALAAPLLATGCSKGFGALGTPPKPGRDVALLTAAIGAEKLMVARYQQALAQVPALAGTLSPVLAQHQAHLRALQARLVPGAAGVPPAATATPAPPAVPATAAAAAAYLGNAEAAAASELLGHLMTASASLAQLLASIAASEATHAAALGVKVSAG